MDIVKKIHDDILKSYGSLESPDFSFVKNIKTCSILESICSLLKEEGLNIKEVTDINEDVSFVFIIYFEKVPKFVLQKSFVGDYLCWQRITSERKNTIISSLVECETEIEKKIFSILDGFSFNILNKEILELPIEVKFFLSDYASTCLYHALFSDMDGLPWD